MSQTRVELLAASVDLHNELNLNHGSDTRLRIHTDGKIGIGTATPSTLFTVKNSTASSDGAILVQNASYAASQDFPILIAGTSGWTGANTDWGTFGFQFKLKSDASSVARIAIETSNSGTIVEGVSIEETGYVGLNVTNPTEQLDIDGNIKITGTVDGRDVSVDGAKLDGIAAGAEVNVDTDISHTVNASFISINSSTGSGTSIAVASTTDAGFMSSADKTKLVGIAPGAEVNVQSDWNATSGDALILNKPTIPTNNNQLTNGAGYITSADGGDAATLDGIDSANFLRSDQEDQATVINIGGEISASSSAKFQVYGFSRMGPIMLAAGTTGATSFNTTNERWIMNDGSHLYASTSSSSYNNKIWTDGNDGSGSGLDADKLDNLEATSFLRSDTNDSMSGQLSITGTGQYVGNYGYSTIVLQDTSGYPGIDFRSGTKDWLQRMEAGSNMQWVYRNNGNYSERMELTTTGGLLVNGSTVWHAGNDGSGTGLDADTIDGINSASFLRSDTIDTASGALTFTDTLTIDHNTSSLLKLKPTNSGPWVIDIDRDDLSPSRVFTHNPGSGTAWVFEHTPYAYGSGNYYRFWTTGNDGSASGLDADMLDGYHLSGSDSVSTKIFNNKGLTHGSFTNFDSSFKPGPNFLQGGTNGPTNTTSHQWYGFMLGLGSEYNTTPGDSNGYASQFYWGRQSQTSNNPYLWVRDMETGSWGSWRKMAAGMADTAMTLDAGSPYQTSQSTNAINRAYGMEIDFVSSAQGWPDYGTVVTAKSYSQGGGSFQLYNGYGSGYGGNNLRYRTADYSANTSNPPWTSWRQIWDAGNDGSGSGLDADLLDGYHGSNFIGKNGNSYYRPDTWIDFRSQVGLYWGGGTGAGWHFYPGSTSSMIVRSGASGAVDLNFQTAGTTRGYVYADNSSQIGFLNSAGSWSLKCDNSGNVTATGNVTAYSDIRLKSDIEPITNALDKVEQINGVTYTRIDSGERQTGLIAQEVEKVLPEAVRDGEEYKSVAYGNMMGLLIEAVKELTARVEELEEELKTK